MLEKQRILQGKPEGLQAWVVTRPKHQQVAYQKFLAKQQAKQIEAMKHNQYQWSSINVGYLSDVAQIEIGPHQLTVATASDGQLENYVIEVACTVCHNRASVPIPWNQLVAMLKAEDTGGIAELILGRVQKAVIYWVCACPQIRMACIAEDVTLLLARFPNGLSWDAVVAWAKDFGLHISEVWRVGMELGFVNVYANRQLSATGPELWQLPGNHPLQKGT